MLKIAAAIVAALGLGFTGAYFGTGSSCGNGGCPLSRLFHGTDVPTATSGDCCTEGAECCTPPQACCGEAKKSCCSEGACNEGEKASAVKASPDCCVPGAACCKPGAACCEGAAKK